MSKRFMFSKKISNNNTLFSGITKKSPTNIIFQSETETHQEQNREQHEKKNTNRENKNQQRTLWR